MSPQPQMERRAILDELISRGVRLTAQRRAVVEVIQEAGGHLDAASLLQLARKRTPAVDRATVYRTIELLKKYQLIDELDLMHLEGEKHYYEASTKRDHLHLACFHCGRIEEFSTPMLEHLKAEISMHCGFEIRMIRLEAGGRCRFCASSAIDVENRRTDRKP
jgi:Fur family transcriptional regulator, ferric uptake regulator